MNTATTKLWSHLVITYHFEPFRHGISFLILVMRPGGNLGKFWVVLWWLAVGYYIYVMVKPTSLKGETDRSNGFLSGEVVATYYDSLSLSRSWEEYTLRYFLQ